MANNTVRYALFAGACVLLLSTLLFSGGGAEAGMVSIDPPAVAPTRFVEIAQDGPRFHHGKRTQTAYCLRRNYWWFYRPYTTAQEDFPRCEPYFHYPEQADGRGGGYAERYFK